MTFNSCQQKQKADLILFNGTIYTVDSAFTIAEAMAVKDGRVLATGSSEMIQNTYEAPLRMNLQGEFVYPGFIDAHCHFYGLALMLQQADLKDAASFEVVLDRLKRHRETYNPRWLLGRGWDQTLWENKEMPDNKELDRLFPDIPVVITRIDGHAVVANSKALEAAGINEKTRIEGGEIRIIDGKLTGLLLDKAADRMRETAPSPEGKELMELLKTTQSQCFGYGLTTVADAGLSHKIVELLERMQKSGELSMNLFVMLDPTDENIDHYVKKGIYRTGRLHAGAIKLYADGALGSRGACLLKPYSDDPENSGIMVETTSTLEKYCRIAYENNYQVCVHAIGDSAVRTVLDVYALVLGGKNDRRWRIEHAQVVNESDFSRFAELNIIPSVQPTHATSDMRWAAERLGSERVKNAYAYKRLMEQNGWIPFGTDFPIEQVSPLFTFYAAVFRKSSDGLSTAGFQPENAVSRKEAMKGMTLWAAKSCFEEKEKGSLEPGKFADFVILDKDLMNVPEKDILSSRVLKTYIRGVKVYSYRDDGE